MANRYDEIIGSFGSDEFDSKATTQTPDSTQTPSEAGSGNDQPKTVETQTQSDVKPDTETKPSGTPDQQTETQVQSQDPSNQEEGKHKGAKKQYTHEEQVQFSFAKLNSKLSNTKRELANALKQIEELKKANAPKPQTLNPEDFASQAEYLKYIANQSLIEQLQKAAEAKKTSEAEAQASRDFTNRYNQRASELFSKPEDIEAYNAVVTEAINNGLNDTLNSDKVIIDFIKQSDWAPRLVFHFAAMPEDLEKIMNLKDPTDKRFALNMLQQRIATIFGAKKESTAQSQNQTQTQTEPKSETPAVPIIGKAGTGASSGGSNPEVTMDEAMSRVRRGY